MNSKKLRICIDLDGTICSIKKDNESYKDVTVNPGAKEIIKHLKNDGHTIIIYTARNMRTTGHNVGKAIKNIGKITLDWLEKNEIEYDEIFFGKPNADIMIDDRALRFDRWDNSIINQIFTHAKEK